MLVVNETGASGKVTIDALQTPARERGGSLWAALGETVESGSARALAHARRAESE